MLPLNETEAHQTGYRLRSATNGYGVHVSPLRFKKTLLGARCVLARLLFGCACRAIPLLIAMVEKIEAA